MSTRSSSLTPVRPQETTLAWLIKIATGPLLVILLFVHLTVNHMADTPSGLMTYNDVVRYFNNPWIVAMEVVFLSTVVTHSLLGLRSVILDLHLDAGVMRVINVLLWVLGVGSVVYGVWLALTIASFS